MVSLRPSHGCHLALSESGPSPRRFQRVCPLGVCQMPGDIRTKRLVRWVCWYKAQIIPKFLLVGFAFKEYGMWNLRFDGFSSIGILCPIPGWFSADVCLIIFMSVGLYSYLFIRLFIYVRMTVYLSVCRSIFISLQVCLSICLHVYLSIFLYVYLSICLLVYLPMFVGAVLSFFLSSYISVFFLFFISWYW